VGVTATPAPRASEGQEVLVRVDATEAEHRSCLNVVLDCVVERNQLQPS
jgi:hypothetical protein